MKKLAILILLMFSIATFAVTGPLTANLQTFSSTPANAFITVKLKTAASCLLTTTDGTTIGTVAKNFYPDLTGHVVDVIVPTTTILCNNNPGAAWYHVDVVQRGTNGAANVTLFGADYLVDVSGLAVGTTAPIATTPPAPINNYALRNGSNTFAAGTTQDFTGATVLGIAGGGGSGPTLKTNTVNNSSQTVLDLQNGTGTTVASTAGGVEKVNVVYGSAINTAAQGNDARLSDARTPLTHTHVESDVTSLVADLAARMLAANNLSDLASAATARTNLGLGTAAVVNVPAAGNAAVGEAVKGSDTRLTDARTPTAHAASHANGGGDPVTLAESQTTNLTTDLAAKLAKASNLSDVASASTSRTNLGLTSNAISVASGDCSNAVTSKLLYTLATNTYSCGTDQGGGGGMTNPMTTLGDVITGGAAGAPTRLAGNTTTTPLVLQSTGSAGAATAPTFGTIDYSLATIVNKPTIPADISSKKYIIQTADAALPNAQAMGTLGTGIVKNTTTTGVQSIAVGSDIPNIAESQVTNLTSDLAGKAASGASTTVNGVACALGSTCTVADSTKVPTTTTLTGGAGIGTIGDLSANRTITTDSTKQNFLASGILTCGVATNGAMKVHTSPLQYCDNAGIPVLRYAAYGDSAGKASTAAVADTATALGANGTNCSANQAAGGVDASGNAESCVTPTLASIVPNTAPSAGQIPVGNAGGTAYVPLTTTGCTITSAGAVTCTPTAVGLGSVTNAAQTLASVVPNTVPSAAQLLLGNAGGTAYAPVTLSGPVSVTSAGVTSVATLNQNTTGTASNLSGTPALPNGTTATTQAAADNSTKLATTAYADASLKAQYKIWTCETGLGDGLNAVAAGTYLQSFCFNTTGVTITLTAVKCYTDNAGSSTLNAAGNTLGALLTGAVTCSSTIASGTQSANVLLTNGDYIKFTWVADGTSKQSTWVVTGTY